RCDSSRTRLASSPGGHWELVPAAKWSAPISIDAFSSLFAKASNPSPVRIFVEREDTHRRRDERTVSGEGGLIIRRTGLPSAYCRVTRRGHRSQGTSLLGALQQDRAPPESRLMGWGRVVPSQRFANWSTLRRTRILINNLGGAGGSVRTASPHSTLSMGF